MPRPAFQFALLLLAVPAQYLISEFMTPSTSDRTFMVKRLASSVQIALGNILSLEKWKSLLLKVIKINLTPYSRKGTLSDGECAAVEVLKAVSPNGYFGQSTEVHAPRPRKIKYRVGQVILHKRFGYRGVIIGWDEKAKAPDAWLQANHVDPEWKNQPNYAILVHTDDREQQVTYVVEENIDIVVNVEVVHPELDDYFSSFDGAQYLMRPWLKELYPED